MTMHSSAHANPARAHDGRGACFLTVCVPTFRRLDRLALVLDDIRAQTRPPQQIVVVDNDARGSARTVVDEFRDRARGIEVVYEVQPAKNISLTRNRTVELARGTWIAFIDDDERALPDWLAFLLAAQAQHDCDGVLAPVHPVMPPGAPAWLARSGLYDAPSIPSGEAVPLGDLRSGNMLLNGRLFRDWQMRFDPAFGQTGGEDGDLLMRMVRRGARFVWSQEAAVLEPIEQARLEFGWVLRRAMRGGQDYALHFRGGKLGPTTPARQVVFFARAAAQAVAAALLALVTLPAGRHRAVRWLAKAAANLGKLSTLWGGRFREYA